MTLVRVTVAGTIGKAVRINTDATIGSKVGVDFRLPDNTIPTLEELADALYTASPPGQHVDEEQGPRNIFESDIIDGLLLARVADDEVITGAYTFDTNLTMGNGIPINWKDAFGTKIQFLNLSAGGGALGAEVGHATARAATSEQTTSITYVSFTGATILNSVLDDNEDYLIYVRGVTSNLTSQSTPLNGARLTYNGAEIGNSEMLYESKNGATNDRGHPYQFCGVINSGVAGDLVLQFKSGNAANTVDMQQVTMLMIKVSDLTLNTNIFTSKSTSTVELDDGNFPPLVDFDLGVSLTIGDGSSDYLILGCVGIEGFLSGGNTVTVKMLKDGGSAKVMAQYQRADSTDEIPMGLVGFYEAPAAGTAITLTGVGTGFPVDKTYAFLAAIKMSAFAEVHKNYVATGPTLSGFPGDTDIATFNVSTTLASNNWCFFGSTTENWAASGTTEHALVRANIGGAGDVTFAGDAVRRIEADGTTHTVSRFMVSDDVVIGASVTIDADLQLGHPTNVTGDGLIETILLAFTWELKPAGAFEIGDANFVTKIFGTRVEMPEPVRIQDTGASDYVQFDHDGVDFNITGFQTADINITGITSIQAGTVDVDFDDITATTYGGILEADLLDKSADEVVGGSYTFANNVTKLEGAAVRLIMSETGVGTDEGKWRFLANTEQFIFGTLDDAEAGSGNIMIVNRTATVVDSIAFFAPVTATSYDGILAANLLDKTAAETITESWIWSGSADTITFTGGGPFGIQFRSTFSTTAQQIDLLFRTGPDTLAFERTSDAVKIIEINAATLGVDFAGAITATSYDGILAANLLDKTAGESISGIYRHTVALRLSNNVFLEGFDTGAVSRTLLAIDASNIVQIGTSGIGSINLRAATNIAGALTATSYDGVLAANLLDKSASETITGAYIFSVGPTLFNKGTVSAPGQGWDGDDDTGAFSPGANIHAITVGGVEAVRWTGASIPAVDFALESGITASTTQTQGQRPLTASYNEVSIVANDNDVVTLPVCAKGRLCLVINGGAKKLQVFPASGVDLGQGLNSSTTIEPNSSLFFVGVDPTKWHETDSDKIYRIGHTYGVISKIKVPSGQKDFIIPFFVSLAPGQTAKLVKARHKINAGTSVTCKLQKNGVDVTGFTGISVTQTAADTDPTDVILADNDKLALVVTGISGSPQNMSFTIFIEYTQ